MPPPLVCMYLFLDARGDTVPPHPSRRTRSPLRYLECALVQSASLLRAPGCEVAIATNVRAAALPRRGRRLWAALAELGVRVVQADPRLPRGADPDATRLPWTALRALEGEPGERLVWLPNLDCVWLDPARALAATPKPGRFGCLEIDYPPDWRVGGPQAVGSSREELAATARALGAETGLPPSWIGADLLAGDARTLRELMGACEQLDERLRARAVATNEQLLTLSCALGLARAEDLSPLARRIQTGPRHGAALAADPAALALWHLPAEKGLSLRRTASELLRRSGTRLQADLADPRRAATRFNVGSPGAGRRLRDGLWLLAGRLSR